MAADERNWFDDLIRSSRLSFIARNDASFDFERGLANVYERAGRLLPDAPRRPAGSGPLPAPVEVACDRIDDFVALLGQVILAEELQHLIGSQVQRAAEVLLQVREHVAAGSLSRAALTEAFAVVRDTIGHADLVTLVDRGQSLDDALTASRLLPHQQDVEPVAALLRRLEQDVAKVLTAGSPGPDSAPRRRRRNGSEPGRRRAEGGR